VVVEKREGGWRLVSPIDAPADARTLDDVLAALSFLRAEGFVDSPRAAEEASLSKPALDVRLRTAAGEGAEPREHHLVVGAPVAEGIRLARGAEASLYRVARERVDEVPRRVGAWRHRTLADFTASDAQRLELVFHPKGDSPVTIAVERKEEGWTSTPERISAGKAATLVAELSRLRAEDVEADAMGAKELAAVGLSPPRAVLRAFGAPPEGGGEAPRLAEVWLGEFDAKRGIHAKVPDADTVYRLSYELAESLPVSLEAYRNRFVSKEGEEEAPPPPEEPVRPGGLDVPVLEP
jgi:hypothetical protein